MNAGVLKLTRDQTPNFGKLARYLWCLSVRQSLSSQPLVCYRDQLTKFCKIGPSTVLSQCSVLVSILCDSNCTNMVAVRDFETENRAIVPSRL